MVSGQTSSTMALGTRQITIQGISLQLLMDVKYLPALCCLRAVGCLQILEKENTVARLHGARHQALNP